MYIAKDSRDFFIKKILKKLALTPGSTLKAKMPEALLFTFFEGVNMLL